MGGKWHDFYFVPSCRFVRGFLRVQVCAASFCRIVHVLSVMFLEKQTWVMRCSLNWKISLDYFAETTETWLWYLTAWTMLCSFQRETFRSGFATRWRSLALTYPSAVLPPMSDTKRIGATFNCTGWLQMELCRVKTLRQAKDDDRLSQRSFFPVIHVGSQSHSHRFSIGFSNSMLKLGDRFC